MIHARIISLFLIGFKKGSVTVNTTDLYREDGQDLLKNILDSIILDKENPFDGNYPILPITFYFTEGSKFIAVDNTTCDCWVEEFDTPEEAIKWCKGEIS